MAFVVLFFVAALAILFLMKNRGRGQLPPSPLALPIIGHLHLLGPLVHQSFQDISLRYGPLVFLRLGSVPYVVASTPDVAIELLKTHETTFSSHNDTLALKKFTYQASFIFGPPGPYWKFIKKLTTMELFGSRMLNQFQPLRTMELHCFLQLLLNKSKAGETVNLTQELLNLTNNIFSRMLLSIRCFGKESLAGEATDALREVTNLLGVYNVSDFLWFCRYLDLQGLEKKSDRIHRRFDTLLENIIKERELIRKRKITIGEDNGEGRLKDFLDIMLDALENENLEIQLTRNHIKASVLELLTAGNDTTAIAIEWTLAELINHPQVLEKAQMEIDEVVGKNRVVKQSDVHNLVYLHAIIKETLRLHPPVTMVIRKSTEDYTTVGGYKIPANTVLIVNAWSIGRDPRYWENPLEFLPERFLSGKEESIRDFKGQNFELLPFGTGRRRCPGMSVAIQTISLSVAAIIQCFNLRVAGADEGNGNGVDMSEGPGFTTPRASDLVCTPVIRSPQPLGTLET